jgi:hypothetical protein
MERQWRAIERRALPNGVWTTRERGTSVCLSGRLRARRSRWLSAEKEKTERDMEGGREKAPLSFPPLLTTTTPRPSDPSHHPTPYRPPSNSSSNRDGRLCRHRPDGRPADLVQSRNVIEQETIPFVYRRSPSTPRLSQVISTRQGRRREQVEARARQRLKGREGQG